MKVIGQLINYFQARGALSPEQLDYLVRQGFLIGQTEDEADDTIVEECETSWPAPEPDDDHEAIAALPAKRRGRGGVRHKGRVVEPREIADWIAERLATWQPSFTGFQQVAARLAEHCSWQEAVKRIRRTGNDELRSALALGLSEQDVSMQALWDSLGFDEFQALSERPGLRGTAMSAYRALLAAGDVGPVIKHQWLLRYEPISDVYNVLSSQRRLAQVFGTVFDDEPPLVSAAMRRRPHPLAFWSLVLLYNAIRGSSPYGSLSHREYGPLLWLGDDLQEGRAVVTWGEGGQHCGPGYPLWMRAWSLALLMKSPEVTAFFADSVNCDDPTPLMCPAGWRMRPPT
jgi:hypothetical protein